MVCVFSRRSCDDRDLHSFPTRRSSDLAAPLAAGPRQETAVVAVAGEIYVIGGFDEQSRVVADVEAFDPALGTWRARARSEEHTSELQSRRDLVCRLLLEKKKNHLYVRC